MTGERNVEALFLFLSFSFYSVPRNGLKCLRTRRAVATDYKERKRERKRKREGKIRLWKERVKEEDGKKKVQQISLPFFLSTRVPLSFYPSFLLPFPMAVILPAISSFAKRYFESRIAV